MKTMEQPTDIPILQHLSSVGHLSNLEPNGMIIKTRTDRQTEEERVSVVIL